MDFTGVKAAIMFGEEILVYLRDNKENLPFPNKWDLPGGGREGNEQPFECLVREVFEEFGITITPEQVVWHQSYPSWHNPELESHFYVLKGLGEQRNGIVFGDEGQYWKYMPIQEFISLEDAIPHQQDRVREFLSVRMHHNK